VSRVWNTLQVEHQGQYSIEYLCRANKFCQCTAIARSALVLVLTPLPCLVVVLAIECIPLEDPALGVEHALLFWVRAFLVMLTVDFLVLHQLRLMIPTLPSSNIIIFALSAFSSLGAVVALFGMAKTIGFPLPFTTLLAAPVTSGLLGACTCAMWARFFRTNTDERKYLFNYIAVVAVQVAATYVYSSFAFVIAKVDGLWQIPIATLLAILMHLNMALIGYLFRDKQDTKVNMVVLNATIYHVLFVSWCLNGSRSVYSTLIFVLLDLGEMLLAYNGMQHMHAELVTLFQQFDNTRRSRGPTSVVPADARGGGAPSLLDVGIAIWEHDRDTNGAHPDVQRISDTQPAMAWQSKCGSNRLHLIGPASSLTQTKNPEIRAAAVVKSVLMTTVQRTDPGSNHTEHSYLPLG